MEGQRVLLIEKETWPRDKICGDAVGGKSLSHVKRLGVKETLENTPHFRVTGIVFSSPKGHSVRVALPEEDVQRLEAGYSLPRQQFDHLLFNQVQRTVRDAGGAVLKAAMCVMFSTTMETAATTPVKAAENSVMLVGWWSESADERARSWCSMHQRRWRRRIPMPRSEIDARGDLRGAHG